MVEIAKQAIPAVVTAKLPANAVIGTDADDRIVGTNEANRELLTDGSFETAVMKDGTWGNAKTVGGWQTDTKIEVWGKDFLGVKATNGSKIVELDADHGLSRIWQDVQTVAGKAYTFSFDFAARPNTALATNTIEIYWNDKLVGTFDPKSTAWETAKLSLIGTGGKDRIEFREQSGDNDSYGGLIDNVSLREVSDGRDVIIGGKGNDVIEGQSGDDVMYGGKPPVEGGQPGKAVATFEDNDTIFGGDGNDTIYGNHGDDVLQGERGNDWLSGGRGNDKLYGGDGNDTLYGNSGDDILVDGKGNDKVYGGSGDDLVIAGEGDDEYVGGSGFDTLSFANAGGGVTVDMSKKTAVGAGSDRFSGFEAIEGSQFDDVVKGSKAADMIKGGAGNDVIRGLGGADILTGGEGSDTFVWGKAEVVSQFANKEVDRITDFSTEDRLDLSALLKGLSKDQIADRVALRFDGHDTHLMVNLGNGFHDLAVLEGFKATSVQSMIDDGMFLT